MKRWLPMLAAPRRWVRWPLLTHAAPAPKPDLIVPAGTLVPGGGDEVIIGRHVKRFTWSHRTKNVGSAAAGRRRPLFTSSRDRACRPPRARPTRSTEVSPPAGSTLAAEASG